MFDDGIPCVGGMAANRRCVRAPVLNGRHALASTSENIRQRAKNQIAEPVALGAIRKPPDVRRQNVVIAPA